MTDFDKAGEVLRQVGLTGVEADVFLRALSKAGVSGTQAGADLRERIIMLQKNSGVGNESA